jgi:hypothetical protein
MKKLIGVVLVGGILASTGIAVYKPEMLPPQSAS